MNLGITRFYSTNSKPSILKSVSVPKIVRRQNLFLENYLLIKNILDNNNNLDYKQKQRKIEYLLYNQESKFLDSLPKDLNMFNSINYTDSSFDYIKKIKNDLIKLLSKSSFKSVSKQNSKDSSQMWVPKIIEVLAVDNIANLLLSFLMEVLSKETISTDNEDVETPGIPNITAFEKFGSKLISKYIYTIYIKSGFLKKGKSLAYFKSISDFSDFDEDVFMAKLGGHFVGALLEIGILYQDLDVKVGTIKEKEYYIRVDNIYKKKSPFDHFTSITGKLLCCWKFGCQAGSGSGPGSGSGSAGIGLVITSFMIDSMLEAGNHEKVFTPLIGKGVKFLVGGKPADNVLFGINENQK